jgi:hypothetical protein
VLTPTAYNNGEALCIKPDDASGDFQFSRNSAATRVNAQGLVENVQSLGSELITNGDFATDSDWGLGTNWSISGGSLNAAASTSTAFQQNTGIVTNKTYKVTYTISNYVSGSVRIEIGSANVSVGIIRSANGTYTEYITALGDDEVYFDGIAAFTGSIDNVSVKEVIDNTNLPRINYQGFSYDGSGNVVPNSGCGSWLWEPQSTNLITQSELFSDSYWTKSASSITSDAVISPDGTLNADKLVENTSNTSHHLYSNIVAVGVYTLSVFVKKGEREYVYLYSDAVGKGKSFNLTNGTIDADIIAPPTSAKIDNYGNGWYRCSMTITANSGAFRIGTCLANGNFSYQGDGTSGIYIWGGQLEALSYPTSMIPTSGSTVTRNQDVCNNGGSLATINSTSGTLYVEMAALADDGTNRVISLSDNTSNNRVLLLFKNTTNTIRGQFSVNGQSSITIDTLVVPTAFNKIAFKWNSTSVKLYANGIEIATTLTGYTFVANSLNELSFDNVSGGNFFGKTKALAVWKEALSDSELQSLTTI